MTDMMNLRALVEKTLDAHLLREMTGFAAQRLMELEVEDQTGTAYAKKKPEHLTPAQRLPRPDLGDPRQRGRTVDSQAAPALLLSGFP